MGHLSETFDFFAFFNALLDAPKSERFQDGGLDTLSMMVALAIARNHKSGREVVWWYVPIELDEEHAYDESGQKRRTLKDQTGMARTTISRRIERLVELNIIRQKPGRTSYAYQPVPPDEWETTGHSERFTQSLRSVHPITLNGSPGHSDARSTTLNPTENTTTNLAPASPTQPVAISTALEAAERWVKHSIERGDKIRNFERVVRFHADCYTGFCDGDHAKLHGVDALNFHRGVIEDEEQTARASQANHREQSDLMDA